MVAQQLSRKVTTFSMSPIGDVWNQEEKEKYEVEMERIEEQDREEETNEDIPRIVLDPYKKVKVNHFEISEDRGGE